MAPPLRPRTPIGHHPRSGGGRLLALVLIGLLWTPASGPGSALARADAAGAEAPIPPSTRASQPPASPDPGDDTARRTAAAHAGIRWMLLSAPAMPEGWVYPFLVRLYRIVGDEKLLGTIDTVLRASAASGRHVDVPDDLESPRMLAPARLSPILSELERRKDLGLPYQESASQLERQIARGEHAFWNQVPASQRASYLYFFAELGIETRLTVDKMISGMRQSAQRNPREELAANDRYLYGLTHLILTRSRYFRRYVDRDEFAFALPILRASLAHHVDAPPTVGNLDAIGSILVALSLLQVPESRLSTDARERLMAEQNPNGSWGPRLGADRAKTHATLNGVLATLEYPAEFRVRSVPQEPPR